MSTTTTQTRSTRIVCISDTHNQTPHLPKGDILIHAGDLTNQGTYSELSKQVAWLEKTDFEIKIVVAGNHDLTLDAGFYRTHWERFHNQRREDAERCAALLRGSGKLVYLEHEAREVRLTGAQTRLTVFGSAASPAHGRWAFGYAADEAEALWAAVPLCADVVVTHTPPRGHCDAAENARAGCAALLRRLGQIQPRLHVCGHIHEGRGAELIRWGGEGAERTVEYWRDPGRGEGNRKQSRLSLRADKASEWFSAGLARSRDEADERRGRMPGRSRERGGEDKLATGGGGSSTGSADGSGKQTCVVNAAIMQNSHGGPRRLNKPIVVDIELPV